MGKKVHPFVFRIGETTNWKSRWFSQKKYKDLLREDYLLRKFTLSKLAKAGLSHIEIERSSGEIRIIIFTSRPGLIIGRGGAGIDTLKNQIEKYYLRIRSDKSTKMQIKLQIEEVLKPDSNSQILGQQIAEQIEKRMPFRRVLKQALTKVMQNQEVEGAKIMISGRLDGVEMARTEWLSKGKIPLQTIRANIDYAQVNSYCRYGVIGIKIWIYKGEVFQSNKA